MNNRSGIFDLTGRTAFVAGACGKIGRAICHALAVQGCNVIVADLQAEECMKLVHELDRHIGGKHLPAPGDLTHEEHIQGALHTVTACGPLHILIHCIGLTSSTPIPGYAVPFSNQTLKSWELALKTNLTSAFLLSKLAYTYLEKKGQSSVIFLSSIYGSLGPNWSLYEGTDMSNPVAYGATKGGLEQLMRYLATLWAPGVRVNCISPGGVEHGQPETFVRRYEKMTPLQRMATPEDIAGPVVFLASDAARYITGQNLMVDGGWSAW